MISLDHKYGKLVTTPLVIRPSVPEFVQTGTTTEVLPLVLPNSLFALT